MISRLGLGLIGLAACAGVEIASAQQNSVNVVTYHYDNLRTGWNQNETVLTTSNVNSSTFGPLARVALDDQVDAQPLIVNNVVYVATENDTVYAINASTGAILNSNHLGAPVAMSNLPGPCNNNGQHVGINSTPVINAVAGLMWVVTYTWESNAPVFRLHLLSLTNLTEIKNTIITASHTLSDGSVNNFNPQYQRQRAALLLQNLNVYAAFSSFCDLGGNNSRGWILGWQAETLTPLAANELTDTQTLAQTPNGTANVFLSSIWMSGYGVASDSSGDLFFTTGNSDTVKVNNYPESAVRLSSDLTTVKDFFTPQNFATLDTADSDFSSGGIMLLPAQSGPVPNLAVAAGKSGYLYIMNRALGSMGGYVAGGPDVPKEITLGPCWCGPSYFAGSDGFGRVVTSQGDVLDTWRVDTTKSVPLILEGTSSLAPDVQDPGFFTSVSSNGTQAGSTIIWAVQRPTSATTPTATLYAYSATPTVGALPVLYSGVVGPWPNLNGNANLVPVVANGNVYVASYQSLSIFGLLSSSTSSAAQPLVAPGATSQALVQANTPAASGSRGSVGLRTFGTAAGGVAGDQIGVPRQSENNASVNLTNAHKNSQPLIASYSSYTPPNLTSPFALALGDSISAKAFGLEYVGSTFESEVVVYGSYLAQLYALSLTDLLPHTTYNYGVGGTSTAGIDGRVTRSGNDCNYLGAATSQSCSTALFGTVSSGGGSGTNAVTLAAQPAGNPWAAETIPAQSNWIVNGTPATMSIPLGTTISNSPSSPYTSLTASANFTANAITAPSAFLIAPAANFSNAAYSQSHSNIAVDASNNYHNTGNFSAMTDPAQVVFLEAGTNDFLAGGPATSNILYSLQNIADMLDCLGPYGDAADYDQCPTGANKIVILSDETPRGLAESYSIANNTANGSPEVHTAPIGGGSITVIEAARFVVDDGVYYLPAASSGPPFVAGPNDGVMLTNCTPCTPQRGQYNASAGVYTFAGGDGNAVVGIDYRWSDSAVSTAPNYLTTIHDWIDDSTHCSANFQDPISNQTYPISGAQCNRPWVHVAQTWNALLDPTSLGNCITRGNNCYNAKYTLPIDGLHPGFTGGQIMAGAMLRAARNAGAVKATSQYPLPIANNPTFNATTNTTGTITTTCTHVAGTSANYYLTNLAPSIAGYTSSSLVLQLYPAHAPLYFDTAAAGITGGSAIIDCWDTKNNVVHITQPASASLTVNPMATVYGLLSNGVVSYTIASTTNDPHWISNSPVTGCGTNNTNCGSPLTENSIVKGYPGGWTIGMDHGDQISIGANTLGFAYGIEQDPLGDGYDSFTMQFQGFWGNSPTPTVKLTASFVSQINSQTVLGSLQRAVCRVGLSPGPNGRLLGISSVSVSAQDTTSNAFVAPGSGESSSTYTTWTASSGNTYTYGGAARDSSVTTGNPGVTNGVLILDIVSPPIKIVPSPAGTVTPGFSVVITGVDQDPVSATVRIERCAYKSANG